MAGKIIVAVGLVLLLAGVALYSFGSVFAATIVSWGSEPVVIVDPPYAYVGKEVVYRNDRPTAAQICPHVIIVDRDTGVTLVDSGKRLAWVVNPGEVYRCTVGWSFPASYEPRNVHVTIYLYVEDAVTHANCVLEDVIEFDAYVPAMQPPAHPPDIRLAMYNVTVEQVEGLDKPYAITIHATLQNTGGSGVAEIYFIVDGQKVPPGESMFYVAMAAGEMQTIRFGRWLSSGSSITMCIYSKPSMTSPPCTSHTYTITVAPSAIWQQNQNQTAINQAVVQEPVGDGDGRVVFSPVVGVLLSLAGCVASCVGAVMSRWGA